MKTRTIRRYLSPEEHIGHDASASALKEFLNRPGGAIWRIFWLHLQHPKLFPIYDQHVHRAMAFLQTGEREEIPDYDPQKVESYWRRYLPFHATFEGIESRSVDKALWAFGKFLKEYRFPTGPLNGK